MPLDMMATSTAAFGLIRTLGSTVGISVGGTIFSSEVQRRLKNYIASGQLSGAALGSLDFGAIQRNVQSINDIPVSPEFTLSEQSTLTHGFLPKRM